MTVPSSAARNTYTTTLGQTSFPYTFKILYDTDLEVYGTPSGQTPNTSTDLLILNVDYTVQGVGDENGGTITLTPALASGTFLVIVGNLEVSNPTAFTVGFTASQLNGLFDRSTTMLRNLKTRFDELGLKYPVNAPIVFPEECTLPQLPNGYFWQKAASGPGIAAVQLEENPDWSTLRTELESQTLGADGSRLIGYSDGTFTGTVHDQIALLKSQISALTSQVDQAFPIGILQYSMVPLNFSIGNWLLLNSIGEDDSFNTIGNGVSGALLRANDDTQTLFELYWNTFSDNNLVPVSGGRGVSATADFTAGKTLQLGIMAGRAVVIGGRADPSIPGRNGGNPFGEFRHMMTVAELPPFTLGMQNYAVQNGNSVASGADEPAYISGGTVQTLPPTGAVAQGFELNQPSQAFRCYIRYL